MKKIFILISTLVSLTTQAQLFTQDFNGGYNLSNLINFSTTSKNQFNGIGPLIASGGANDTIILDGTKKLRMVRATGVNCYFERKYLNYSYPQTPVYGALIKVNNPSANKPAVAKKLGIIHLREAFTLTNPSSYDEPMYDSSYKIVLNINYDTSATYPKPYPDSATYTNAMRNALKVSSIKPALIVIENEEYNGNYHTGTAAQYIKELQAGVRLADSLGFKATNGGITAEVLRYLTWEDMNGRDTAAAAAFKANTDVKNGYNTHYSAKWLNDTAAKFVNTLITAYATIPMDYVNFHWYGSNRGAASDILDSCIEFLKRRTGKPVITNEMGQYDTLGTTVLDLLSKVYQKQLPVVMWYDGDGEPAFALNDKNGNFRSNGYTLRDFLANNHLNYTAPQFISVTAKIKVKASANSVPITTGNYLMVGNGLPVDSTNTLTDSIHSKIGITFTGNGGFRFKDPVSTIQYPSVPNAALTGEQVIKWYINNTGSTVNYAGPGNTGDTLANDSWSLFVKAEGSNTWTKGFKEKVAAHGNVLLNDLKFVYDGGTDTLYFDSVVVINETSIASRQSYTSSTISPAIVTDNNMVVSFLNTDAVHISLPSITANPATVLIYDIAGRKIAVRPVSLFIGDNRLEIPVRLEHGIYIIVVNDGKKNHVQKLSY